MYGSLGALALALSQATGAVHVVDDDGGAGVGFTDLQAAVDAAADGDLILVRNGTYAGFVVDGKALSIVADTGAQVDVVGAAPDPQSFDPLVRVRAVPVGGVTVLADLRFAATNGEALAIDAGPSVASVPVPWQGAGLTWVEDCTVAGALSSNPFQSFFTPGALTTSARLLVVDSVLAAGGDTTGFGAGSQGLEIRQAPVFAYDTLAVGGSASIGLGAGAQLASGSLFASGCTFVGAAQSFGGGTGEAGLQVLSGAEAEVGDPFALGTPSSALLLDSATIGGGDAPDVDLGAAGVLIQSAATLPARHYDKPTVTRTGEAGVLTLTATPGELGILLFGTTLTDVYLPAYKGYVAPGQPLFVQAAGVIGPSGTLDVPYVVNVPPGVPFLRLIEQAAFFSVADGFVMGTPRVGFLLGAGL